VIELQWGQVAWVSGTLAIAASIQGVAGFGFMLIAAAGLIQLYPAQLVVPGLALVYIPLGIAQTFQVRRQVDVPLLRAWMLSALFGLLPGTLILTAVDSLTMKRGIGVVMMILAILLRVRPGEPVASERFARFGAGLLSGALGASTSVAGPPIVLFGIKQRWEVEPFRASLLAYFTVLSAVIVLLQHQFGLVTVETAVWAAGGLPGIVVGFVVANLMRDKVSDGHFRVLGVALVFGSGVMALLF
tara:strand:+ start:2167 stop:2898 length:732 start_codon:yes stop_codon:yes gene_type:complete